MKTKGKHGNKRAAKRKRAVVSQAIVSAPETPAPGFQRLQDAHGMLVVPSIKETIERLESVRKFVVSCLNQGLKRAEAKAKKSGQLALLTDAQRRALEIDYGTIPGVDKPFLKQPGAEKIALWLHVRPKYVKADVQLPDGHLETVARCILHSVATSEELFQGPDCSCSSMESNFRFRFVEADPQPSREDARKAVFEGRGKWKYQHVFENNRVVYENGKPVLERKFFTRYDNPNIHDERNKIRQQAEKRALVKAIRNYGALSEIFVEDPSEWEFEPELLPERAPKITEVGRIVKDESVPKTEQPGVLSDIPNGLGKTVQLVFLSEAGEAAHVSGDIGEIKDFILKKCHGHLVPDSDGAVIEIPGSFVDVLAAQVRAWHFTFQEVSRKRHDSKPGSGVVVMTKGASKPGSKTVDYYQVLIRTEIGSAWHFCYKPELYTYLANAKDKEVQLTVNGKVIVGIERIGDRVFDAAMGLNYEMPA